MNVKDLIKNNTVHIDRYRQQHVYYRIRYLGEDYTFPVPLEDVQDATLHSEEKAITMMRYIRKALDEGTLIKA